MEKRFLTAKELAVYLALSEDTVRKWALRGKLPCSNFGKPLRFDLRRIEVWLKYKESPYTRKEFT